MYQGQNLVEDTVVVTLQYRLGPLGFLGSDALRNRTADNSTGNYGILDQRLALQWVHENIHAFGGDPAQVFLFGHSSGSESVTVHLVSEESWPYFSSAGLESAALTSSAYTSMEKTESEFQGMLKSLNCTSVECLLEVSDETLFVDGQMSIVDPTVDGVVIKQLFNEALDSGAVREVPMIVGNNANDDTLTAQIGGLFVGVLSAGMTEEGFSKLPCGLGENLHKNVTVPMRGTKEGKITTSLSEAFSTIPETTPPLVINDEVTPDYWKGVQISQAMDWVCPSLQAAEMLSPRTPIYFYDFRAQPNVSGVGNGLFKKEGDDLIPIQGSVGAAHGAELFSVFSSQRNVGDLIASSANSTAFIPVTVDGEEAITSEQVSTLTNTMSQAWINFAKTHVPGFGWKPWTQDDPNRAIFDYNTGADAVVNEKAYQIMMQCAVLNELTTCGPDFAF